MKDSLFSFASSALSELRNLVEFCYLKAFSISLSLFWISFGKFSKFSALNFFLEVKES